MSFLRSVPSLLLMLAPLLFFRFYSACAESGPQVVLHPRTGNPVHVTVEIVATEEKRAFGLMYRKEMPELHGMLFLFPKEQPLSFWMKNTPLSLDIIYINAAHTIVGIAQKTMPFSQKPLPSIQPAQFVLEVNGGFCQRHGITPGDRVELPASLPRAL
jgi:uncharacterized membrane protein (UPF0127 family)